MGKTKNKKQETKTKQLNKFINRNHSPAKRGNRNFRNYYDFSRQPEGYGNYGNYGSYSYSTWHRGNHSSNTRPYRTTRPYRKPPSRPVSPVLGSEEYMVRKIQQTSAIIMRKLLNPEEEIIDTDNQTVEKSRGESNKSTCEQNTKVCEKPVETVSNKSKNKRINNYNIEEIQKKILNHITNLNNGRKRNLINSDISGYDAAIQQIQKQKRLEISRALRDMCSKSKETQESSDFINSIIPDMGIKIEDLPRDVIEQLRNTLNLDIDCGIFEDTGYTSVGEYQTWNENIVDTNQCFINDVAVPGTAVCIKPESIDEPYIIIDDEEECNELKENDDQKNLNITTSDNIGNQQQEAENKNVLDTENNFKNKTVHPVHSIKEEPKEFHLGIDDILNCNENKNDDNQKNLDTSCGENVTFRPHIIKQEIENETTDVDTPQVNVNLSTEKDNAYDFNSLFTAQEQPQTALDNTARNESVISFRPVTIKKEIESETSHVETSQPEANVNLNNEKNVSIDYNFSFTDKNQSEITLDDKEKSQDISFKPVPIKQEIESETSHLETSQHEISVNINTEKNDWTDYNFSLTADKENQSGISLDNDERNQSTAIEPITAKQDIEGTPHLESSQPEVSSEKSDHNLFTNKENQSETILDNTETNKSDNDGKLNNAISTQNYASPSESTLHKTNRATQTEVEKESAEKSIDLFLAKYFSKPPGTISEAVGRMLKIDRCILKLTKYRQSLFNNFKEFGNTDNKKKKAKTGKGTNTAPPIPQKRKADQQINRTKRKKKYGGIKNYKQEKDCRSVNNVQIEIQQGESLECERLSDTVSQQNLLKFHEKPSTPQINEAKKNISDVIENDKQRIDSRLTNTVQKENERVDSLVSENIPDISQQKLLTFQEIPEKILVLKVVENKLVAATDGGKVIFCSLEDGHYIKVMEVGNVPITSILFIRQDKDYIQMFVGSFELHLMQFIINKFQSHRVEKNVNIEDDSVQCMESKWGYIFIGGMRGSLLRYSLNSKRVEYADKFNDNTILVLKAREEGARRILIIGSRNSSICIRDAMTGLHMRVLDNEYVIGSPTVYSLILDKNFVYSGTTNHDILVFCFHDGKLIHRLKATDSKGISCMKIVKNLLFASCHNGSIFVYNLKDHSFIGNFEGPGGVILSMEVSKDQVIVGTMSSKFTSVPIPSYILRHKLK